ncbi:MAG: HNH endonuclease domain-containing protein, partial [Bacteroidota bacterium]
MLHEVGSIQCIYTNNDLVIGNYAVEHFVPYSFVSHDLMWNLIPADTSFNSSKSDKLPR